jgi:hypothetical protein
MSASPSRLAITAAKPATDDAARPRTLRTGCPPRLSGLTVISLRIRSRFKDVSEEASGRGQA